VLPELIKIAIFGVNQQFNIMYDSIVEEVDGPHQVKAAMSPRGVLHGKLGEYDELNNMDREIVIALTELVERFNGPSPEKLNENINKTSQPSGLVEGLDRLNRKHSENFEKSMQLITTLRELI
jgi:hypothetical protein